LFGCGVGCGVVFVIVFVCVWWCVCVGGGVCLWGGGGGGPVLGWHRGWAAPSSGASVCSGARRQRARLGVAFGGERWVVR